MKNHKLKWIANGVQFFSKYKAIEFAFDFGIDQVQKIEKSKTKIYGIDGKRIFPERKLNVQHQTV